jgi:hypothetical protein
MRPVATPGWSIDLRSCPAARTHPRREFDKSAIPLRGGSVRPALPAYLLYRLLAATTALFCMLVGLIFIVAFLDRALFQIFTRPLFDTNYWGYYILGFAGSALLAWAGCLIAAARDPEHSAGIGTATATGLMLGSILRLLAWYSGEYRPAADQLRLESAILVVLALGFVWLRPQRGGRA